jgi:hypothetical protein
MIGFNTIDSKFLFLFILVLSLAARIYIVFFYAESWYTYDSYSYFSQAELLLEGKYPAYFPNGFPFIITLFIFITGSIVTTGTIIILLNIILSTLIVFLVYCISLSLYKEEKLALIAALLIGLYPNQINYVRFILSDIPCTFLLVLSLYLFQQSKYKFSAVAAGFASIIRTVFLPLGILFSLYLFKKKEYKTGRTYLIYFLIPVSLLILYGYIISSEITIGKNAFHNLTLTANNLEGGYTNAAASFNDYFSYLINDPVKFIKDRFFSLWELWGPLASITKWEKASLHYRILAGLRFPLLLLALYGFFKIPISNEKVFIALAVLILTAVHFFYFSSSRHSLSVEPFLVILGAKGLNEVYSKFFNSQLLKNKNSI